MNLKRASIQPHVHDSLLYCAPFQFSRPAAVRASRLLYRVPLEQMFHKLTFIIVMDRALYLSSVSVSDAARTMLDGLFPSRLILQFGGITDIESAPLTLALRNPWNSWVQARGSSSICYSVPHGRAKCYNRQHLLNTRAEPQICAFL